MVPQDEGILLGRERAPLASVYANLGADLMMASAGQARTMC